MACAELDVIKLSCGHLALPSVKYDSAVPGITKKRLQKSKGLI